MKINHTKLHGLRKEFHLSVAYVAGYCKIEESELNSIEAGTTEPTDEVLEKLSLIFAVSTEYFAKPDATPLEQVLAFQKEISKQILG